MRTGDEAPACHRIPPIRWSIWAPCIVIWAAIMLAILRYFWAMMCFNAGSLYAISSKQEPPGESAGLSYGLTDIALDPAP